MARRVRTATALRWVRPPMATSMPLRTGTPTRTPAAAGRVQARTLRNTTHPATPAQALPRAVLVAGEGRRRAVALRPLTAEGAAGNPGRPVLAGRKAGAAVVGGEVAGEPNGASRTDDNLDERRC